MEIQLRDLIEQIKKDGVETAEAKAAEIIKKAEEEAERTVSEAKEEAEELLRKAKEENERFVKVSEEAIKQAGRNMLISFRESVAKELAAITESKITEAYSADASVDMIVSAVEAWAKDPDAGSVSVLLKSDDLKKLESSLLSSLKEKLLTGVTLKPNDSFDAGFRISVSNGRAYYDYSAEAVTEMISAYMSPRVTALMKEAEKA